MHKTTFSTPSLPRSSNSTDRNDNAGSSSATRQESFIKIYATEGRKLIDSFRGNFLSHDQREGVKQHQLNKGARTVQKMVFPEGKLYAFNATDELDMDMQSMIQAIRKIEDLSGGSSHKTVTPPSPIEPEQQVNLEFGTKNLVAKLKHPDLFSPTRLMQLYDRSSGTEDLIGDFIITSLSYEEIVLKLDALDSVPASEIKKYRHELSKNDCPQFTEIPLGVSVAQVP